MMPGVPTRPGLSGVHSDKQGPNNTKQVRGVWGALAEANLPLDTRFLNTCYSRVSIDIHTPNQTHLMKSAQGIGKATPKSWGNAWKPGRNT